MWVTYQDVANRWTSADTFPVSQTVTETLIEDAEAIILQAFPTIQSRITSGELASVLVRQVVANMIIGYVTNGNGLSQHSQTVGPYTDSKSYSVRNSRIEMMLTEADRQKLSPTGLQATAGSIETILSYDAYNNYGSALTQEDRMNGWQFYGRLPL